MLERIAGLENELRDVEMRLGDPAVQSDPRRLAELGRRHKQLSEIVATGRRLRSVRDDLDEARRMHGAADAAERAELREMIDELETAAEAAAEELRVLLLPPDPNEGRNVIVEIRGAAGGEEANLFARDLFVMYQAFARRQRWRLEPLAASPSDLGGYTEVSGLISGDQAWTRMKHEAGTHRVQRVPVTESQGRVHTSSATVSVLPEAEEVDVRIDDAELQVDVFRSSGPGGQSVNTTDSAVRITHLPSGLVVAMQDEKSQLQNKQKALRVLRSRLLQAEQDRASAEQSAMRRGQVGGGDRSEKIRTYNMKENRVTDHRIGVTLYKLDRVLAGELDELSDALVQDEQRALLAVGDA
ncbi:MAG: peptide chain release factor 1 [Acidimicrobiaceae bacterium]|nr:peptide chain release factor 1 [Acidimicrobiaceae bacterium]MXZ98908.1 peptide chain release factor 1 [Acidimicrobiaceae bacterium]MYE96830.1 peptide chain release factor 1 [Acidimicrobiaceae bacterium]MYH42672.1 peptide chain release factor 1 [Acidimicrobiaceae bacterium]MYI54893.1 peptide chain release factor 1 [Acidimicrobiaceae bacterium]